MKQVKYSLPNQHRLNAFYVRCTAWYWSVCDVTELKIWIHRERYV